MDICISKYTLVVISMQCDYLLQYNYGCVFEYNTVVIISNVTIYKNRWICFSICTVVIISNVAIYDNRWI